MSNCVCVVNCYHNKNNSCIGFPIGIPLRGFEWNCRDCAVLRGIVLN